MNKSVIEKEVLVSPLDMRHYVLDIPVVKKELQVNAVKFALRSLYPGNDETTVSDFYYAGKNVIGIASNNDKLQNYKNKGKKLISPTKLINIIENNSIVLYFGDEWIEIQVIQKKQTKEIKTFAYNNYYSAINELNTYRNIYKSLEVRVYTFTSVAEIINKLAENLNCEILNIFEIVKKNQKDRASIFERKKKYYGNIIFSILIIFLSIFLFLKVFIRYKESVVVKTNLENIKKEYNEIKKESEVIKETNEITIETRIEQKISINYILSEISKTSPTIRIISFSYNGKEFKIEAEKANALKVIQHLSNLENISEVTMHHSLPQDDGTERFVISGNVKNE